MNRSIGSSGVFAGTTSPDGSLTSSFAPITGMLGAKAGSPAAGPGTARCPASSGRFVARTHATSRLSSSCSVTVCSSGYGRNRRSRPLAMIDSPELDQLRDIHRQLEEVLQSLDGVVATMET